MEFIGSLLTDFLSLLQRLDAVDAVVISINLLLMIFAKPIIKLVYHDEAIDRRGLNRVHILRILNLFIIIAFSYYHLSTPIDNKGPGLKLVSILVVIYMGYLIAHIIGFFIRQKYGRIREINGSKKSIETYNSRLLSLFSGVFIFIIVLISVIQILEFDSLLEAGGVIGFIGVFFALTQNAWAPDIFSGLIILNSGMVEEGDVIELGEGEYCLGMIFKTKMFHTEILNMINNHRIMIKNSKLREYMIHNLSKFASAKGLRENLHFKIGYDVDVNDVRGLFNTAFKKAVEDPEINIEDQYPLEIGIFETGDHAIEWVVYYHTKDIKNLIRTRQRFRELILKQSKEQAVNLATPLTYQKIEH